MHYPTTFLTLLFALTTLSSPLPFSTSDTSPTTLRKSFILTDNPLVPNADCASFLKNPNDPSNHITIADIEFGLSPCTLEPIDPSPEITHSAEEFIYSIVCNTEPLSPTALDVGILAFDILRRQTHHYDPSGRCTTLAKYDTAAVNLCRDPKVPAMGYSSYLVYSAIAFISKDCVSMGKGVKRAGGWADIRHGGMTSRIGVFRA
ncbi:hypothetical protein BJ508DRAFT_332291 [Ascobolus immersus RN42]|uniref:Ecp2 effector protein domain-containing protein n=1 Tax=Ascobolus immersus RN42 TaxID=1160509 RepID=A0A3N4I035_ASCIM|nr:hypothetical protein BJ508DRAFT_332291 [Ascobolus immersus RN42]